ncbi:MAG TPA: metallophosphoesterase [Candidatus Pullichristensenella excrementipullorum]|nr:metallophosphoesterase [Candidatus Pullichristensenella excrementipullorum]
MREDEKRPEVPDIGSREDDELSQYGDEQDVPVRRRRRSGKTAAKAKTGKKKKASAKKKSKGARGKKRRSFFEWLFSGSPKRAPRRRGALRLFGREIHLSFWPVFLVGIALLLALMVLLQGNSLTVDEQEVTMVGLPEELEGYRILLLSDLNGRRFGDEQATILREIGTLDYDAVFIVGDMVGRGGDPEPFYELLEGLPSSRPVYFIAGDSDPQPVLDTTRDITGTVEQMVLADWILGAIERGATYVDAPVELEVGNASIWISPADMLNLNASELADTCEEQMLQEQEGTVLGLQSDHDTLPSTTYRYKRAQRLLQAVNSMTATDVHISLAHEPPSDEFLSASATHASSGEKYLTQPSLVLAGHYCGGVWRLPGLGAFYIPSSTADRHGWFPAQEDVQGLSNAGGTQMYITAGLSTTGSAPLMFFRFLDRPQISIIELTATLPQNMLEQ